MGALAENLFQPASPTHPDRLRLLSYNIQAGVDTRHFREYLTHSWKQVLPHRERLRNLNRIGAVLHDYDLVGLQEVDSGSLRSGFVDQTEYLARLAGFPYWYKQINRSLGKFAKHSNGVLSRLKPNHIVEHRLPGMPGRGAILLEFPTTNGELLAVCIMHLSLGRRARGKQLVYISRLLEQYKYLVLLGDFNCGSDAAELRALMQEADLHGSPSEMNTFPSWRPQRNLDHILVSSALEISHADVLGYTWSDHLPVRMDILLPPSVRLAA